MEMQEQGAINTCMCDEAHQAENDDEKQEYQGPVTRSRARAQDKKNLSTEEIFDRDEEILREGLPILVHIGRIEGRPILTNLLQKEIVGKIGNGCVQEFPLSVNTLNEFDPKEMVASIVAQDLQNISHWGPDTNSSGPFRNGAPPIQCYNCSGWGHKAHECTSPLNYGRGEVPNT